MLAGLQIIGQGDTIRSMLVLLTRSAGRSIVACQLWHAFWNLSDSCPDNCMAYVPAHAYHSQLHRSAHREGPVRTVSRFLENGGGQLARDALASVRALTIHLPITELDQLRRALMGVRVALHTHCYRCAG